MILPVELADVIELWVWGSGSSMTISQLEAHIETGVPEESIDYSDDDAGEPFEVLAQQVFDEFLERQQRIGTSYPFACDGYKVRYFKNQDPPNPYIFCLLLSYLPATHVHNDQRATQFETLAMNAAENFFGGEALRIGWPWERPTYTDLLDVIGLLPNLGQINLPAPVVAGDRGWDILVVKGFQDGHYPKLIALGNCATGRMDWKRKGMEVQPEHFWECFQHQRPGTWLTFSAVPFRMDSDSRSRKGAKSNLTLDRYRICEFANSISADAEIWVNGQRHNAVDVPMDSSI